jgi:hypothetical protein
MLYMIGFGCRDGPEGLEVGPFGIDSKITEEQLAQQDRYMMRTWVELLLTLRGLHKVESKQTSSDERLIPRIGCGTGVYPAC